MANTVRTGWKQTIGKWGLGEAGITQPSGTLRVALIATAYPFSSGHDFLDDIVAHVIATQPMPPGTTFVSKALGHPSGPGNQLATVTFPAVANGTSIKALELYMSSGVNNTSKLIAYIDTGVTGLPFGGTGADATLTFDPAGVFDL